MPTVWIPPLLRRLAGDAETVTVAGGSVGEVVDALDAAFPGMAARLIDDGRIRPGLSVAVDGIMVSHSLRTPVAADAEIHFVPAIGGGTDPSAPRNSPPAPLSLAVLGCGPIAQIAHFEAIRKARNAELYAICDRAADLRERMAMLHSPRKVYADYGDMLADPGVDAVLVAVADQFHAALAGQALDAGKHVFVEKPMTVTVEEAETLAQKVAETGLILQVGTNKRFDPGIAFARDFIRAELGELINLKAWYCDSTYRYTMTDNLQPLRVESPMALHPPGDPRADRRRYLMFAHGSHLVDTARFLAKELAGEIEAVRARFLERAGAYSWFVEVAFADGTLGHLDLTVSVRGDWDEGFVVNGTGGSVHAKTFLPWFHRASEVDCFSVRDGQIHRPLGADGHTYRRQIEGFADTILDSTAQHGATVHDGLMALRVMVAIARSIESGDWVRPTEVHGGL